MIEQVLEQYADLKKEFDSGSQAEQDAFVKALNDFDSNELGNAFKEGQVDFEAVATDISNMAGFMALLKSLGIDVELP